MATRPTFGRSIAAIAAAVLIGAWLLPAEHLHVSDDHGPTVHRHAGEALHGHETLDDHEAVPDHEGVWGHAEPHHPDDTLTPVYLSERPSRVERPVAAMFEWHLAAPVDRPVRRPEPLRLAIAHGPPIRLSPPRAPPA